MLTIQYKKYRIAFNRTNFGIEKRRDTSEGEGDSLLIVPILELKIKKIKIFSLDRKPFNRTNFGIENSILPIKLLKFVSFNRTNFGIEKHVRHDG